MTGVVHSREEPCLRPPRQGSNNWRDLRLRVLRRSYAAARLKFDRELADNKDGNLCIHLCAWGALPTTGVERPESPPVIFHPCSYNGNI